jgi:hypothetical protein
MTEEREKQLREQLFLHAKEYLVTCYIEKCKCVEEKDKIIQMFVERYGVPKS